MFGEGKFSSSKIQQVYKMHAAFYTYFLWYIVLGCGMRYMLDETCTMCCGIVWCMVWCVVLYSAGRSLRAVW